MYVSLKLISAKDRRSTLSFCCYHNNIINIYDNNLKMLHFHGANVIFYMAGASGKYRKYYLV